MRLLICALLLCSFAFLAAPTPVEARGHGGRARGLFKGVVHRLVHPLQRLRSCR